MEESTTKQLTPEENRAEILRLRNIAEEYRKAFVNHPKFEVRNRHDKPERLIRYLDDLLEMDAEPGYRIEREEFVIRTGSYYTRPKLPDPNARYVVWTAGGLGPLLFGDESMWAQLCPIYDRFIEKLKAFSPVLVDTAGSGNMFFDLKNGKRVMDAYDEIFKAATDEAKVLRDEKRRQDLLAELASLDGPTKVQ